jgi:putative peptidoglycan lipid II flippase
VSSGVGRTSLLLVPVAIASRGAAFLVPVAVAAWFGVSAVIDAWFWALAFPTFALVLAGTSLGTAATPSMAEVRSSAPERLPAFIGGLLIWSALGALLLGVVLCLIAPAYLRNFSEFSPETQTLAARFLWELLPFAILTTAGTVLRVGCEVHERFIGVAITPIVRASAVLLVTWLLLPVLGPHALAAGLVTGEAVQFVWWAALLSRAGVVPKPTLRLDPTIRQVGRDLAPILGGEVLVALNIVVDIAFAGTLPTEGSVATLEYADRARVIPQTLLHSTLAMVAFASWSNLRARGQTEEFRAAVDQALRWTLALSAPVLAGMFIGRFVIIGTLFERGEFSAEDTARTAAVLGYYLPGILPNLLGILAVRAHIVERNLAIIFWLGVASMSLNALFNAMLIGPMGLNGLALATTLNMLIIPGAYVLALSPAVRFPPRAWLQAGALAAAAIGVAVFVELVPGAPRSLWDGTLWLAAVPCFAILGLAATLNRPPPR